MRFLAQLHKEHGADALAVLDTLDLGGGFGIAYRADETPLDVPQLAAELREIVKRECHAAELDVPRIAVEPGRAIAGPGTVTALRGGHAQGRAARAAATGAATSASTAG